MGGADEARAALGAGRSTVSVAIGMARDHVSRDNEGVGRRGGTPGAIAEIGIDTKTE